jgi:hypothetical protein
MKTDVGMAVRKALTSFVLCADRLWRMMGISWVGGHCSTTYSRKATNSSLVWRAAGYLFILFASLFFR